LSAGGKRIIIRNFASLSNGFWWSICVCCQRSDFCK
jgi:hypothetical protein